jgi:hypothetical protein
MILQEMTESKLMTRLVLSAFLSFFDISPVVNIFAVDYPNTFAFSTPTYTIQMPPLTTKYLLAIPKNVTFSNE